MSSSTTSAVPSATSTQRTVPVHHHNPYGYVPTEWICILFIALFSVSTSEYHSFLSEHHRECAYSPTPASRTHRPGLPLAPLVAPPYGVRGRHRRDPRLEREAVVEPKRVPERPFHHAVSHCLPSRKATPVNGNTSTHGDFPAQDHDDNYCADAAHSCELHHPRSDHPPHGPEVQPCFS